MSYNPNTSHFYIGYNLTHIFTAQFTKFLGHETAVDRRLSEEWKFDDLYSGHPWNDTWNPKQPFINGCLVKQPFSI